jgi:hypothetical protein
MSKLIKTHNKKPTSSKHMFSGKEIKVPSQPPEFTSRPWYNLVVRIDNPGLTVTSAQLSAAIGTQLGFAGTNLFQFRLDSVRLWGALVPPTGTTPLQPCVLTILDPIAEADLATVGSQRTLEQYTRFPDQVNRASVGFQYPAAQQCISLASVTGFNLLNISGAGTNSVVYFKLRWRSNVNTAPTSVNMTSTTSTGWFG